MSGKGPQSKLSMLPNILLIFYLAMLLYLVGMLTNWFRYVPSLEAMFVMRAMLLPTMVVVVLYILARKAPSRVIATVILAVAVLASFGVMWASVREAYGSLGKPTLDHIERNPSQAIQVGDRRFIYHLELINPYSAGRAVLVLREGQSERRIDIPLFDRPVAAYVPADEGADWIGLYRTDDPNVLELRTSSYLRGARFEVDLVSGNAEELTPPTFAGE